MTRTRPAIFLALLLGISQIGTARPGAAQQARGSQGADTASQGAATGSQDADAQAPAQPQGDASQRPTFRAGINFVRVDVIVTDDDSRPVTDLSQADFEVLEDGVPQSIEQFKLVRVDGNPPPGEPTRSIRGSIEDEAELARDDTRLFVIFLDDYHVRLANSVGIREPLTRFVQEQLRPNDIVGIMYPLTPLDGISFTRDHKSVLAAISRFEGRKFDYRPRNMFEEQYIRYPTETVEQIRNQVVMTALRGLATRLGGLREGRKAIIYVSEGLTAMLPPQMRNEDALIGDLNNPARRNPMAGENNSVEDAAAFFAESDLYLQLREVFTAANRNNAAIYTLDPRGLAVSEFDINDGVGPRQDARMLQKTQDTLRALAEETDGRAIVNRNDLAEGLAQVVRDSSVYYLIGYTSSREPSDGKFHEITVRVKRRGVDIRARKGYWALTAEEVVRANRPTPEVAKPVQQALASIAPSVQAGKYVRTWLGTAKGENGKTRLTLVWEPLPSAGSSRERPEAGRVSVIAATPGGDLVFRGRSPDAALASAGPPTSPVAGPAKTPQRLVFDAPPGQLELRLTVEAAGDGGTLDTEIRTVTIPDLSAPDAAISTPRVYRARTALEFRSVAADASAAPVPGREFSRAERLLIRFDVYGNATPTAALLNRNGAKMADLPVAPAAAGGTHQIDMGLSAVAAGEYLVEITATGASGQAKELVALRVGS